MNQLLTLSARESLVMFKSAKQSHFVFQEQDSILLLENIDSNQLLRIELKCKQVDKIGNAHFDLNKEEMLKLIHFAINELNIQLG